VCLVWRDSDVKVAQLYSRSITITSSAMGNSNSSSALDAKMVMLKQFFEAGAWEAFHDGAKIMYLHQRRKAGEDCFGYANELRSVVAAKAVQNDMCTNWHSTHPNLSSKDFNHVRSDQVAALREPIYASEIAALRERLKHVERAVMDISDQLN